MYFIQIYFVSRKQTKNNKKKHEQNKLKTITNYKKNCESIASKIEWIFSLESKQQENETVTSFFKCFSAQQMCGILGNLVHFVASIHMWKLNINR